MNLLISKHGDILGQTPTKDNAYRHEILLRTPVQVVTSLKELRLLPADHLTGLIADYQARSIPDLWKRINAAKGLPKWGKVSVKELMRCMYTRDPNLSLTEEELLFTVPGASWDSIATAISMLKNPKYSDGQTMRIDKIDGEYKLAKRK
jgi:hypothetical protein